jgi:hypothetical protein
MMEKEKFNLPVQSKVEVPGLMPPVLTPEGKVKQPDNLAEKAEEIKRIADEKPWLKSLISDVRQGKKSAIFTVGVGSIIIFSAVVGFEFGLRHGKDIRELSRIIRSSRGLKKG